jgi:hypothetical protein
LPRPTRLPLVALVLLAAGCEFEPSVIAVTEPELPAPAVASRFDPANCGRVTGRLTWTGPPAQAVSFVYGVPKKQGDFDIRLVPNPNAPRIGAKSQAVAGAVVYLRGVSPEQAKPWDHPPVRIEMKDRDIRVRQGDAGPRRVGFVRRGDSVSMASLEPVYHILRGRGADFFSLTFPEPNQELTRTLSKTGRVELTSGAGYYWSTATLFVNDHPYYTLTDADGRFALEQVPAGPVEVVAWLPNWNVAKQERDPESGLIIRQTYAPPFEAVRKVTIERGKATEVTAALP